MRRTTIMTIVDVVGALADDSLNENMYLIDDNKSNGSLDEATESLKTAVNIGDVVTWTVFSLEPESYVELTKIEIDPQYCVPTIKYYPDSDVCYWEGTILKELESVPYSIAVIVGNSDTELITSDGPCFIQVLQ
jgi:hypothetical protein